MYYISFTLQKWQYYRRLGCRISQNEAGNIGQGYTIGCTFAEGADQDINRGNDHRQHRNDIQKR